MRDDDDDSNSPLKKQPAQLPVKQELFAQFFVAKGNAADAYRNAYSAAGMAPSTVHESASRLLRNHKVSARIKELRASTAREFGITRMTLIMELDEAIALARAGRKASAMVAAIVAKGRIAGLFDQTHTLTKDRPLSLPEPSRGVEVHDRVLAALAGGEISGTDAHAFARLLDSRTHAWETTELEKRLTELESRLEEARRGDQ